MKLKKLPENGRFKSGKNLRGLVQLQYQQTDEGKTIYASVIKHFCLVEEYSISNVI